MPRPKGGIMTAQEEYLRTGSQEVLGSLYQQLVNLGVSIQRKNPRSYNENAANDVATDICVRLMESKKPVIQSAPSKFVRQAMYYKTYWYNDTINSRAISLEDIEDVPIEERDDEVRSYEDYTASLFNDMEDQSEAMQLAAAVIESRVNWHDIRRAIEDKDFRAEFTRKMKEIRSAVEANM